MPEVRLINSPQKITSSPFDITVSIKGAKSGTNYLRIEIYKDGSNNYFGETFNSKDWYGGSDGTLYFPVDVKSQSTIATVSGRIVNPVSGDYKLKVKRYTSSGNAASDTENPLDVKIEYNAVTPIPSPTPSPNMETGVMNYTPIDVPTVLPSQPSRGLMSETQSPEVLFAATVSGVIHNDNLKNNNFPIIPALAFAFGVFLFGIALYFIYTGNNVSRFKKNH